MKKGAYYLKIVRIFSAIAASLALILIITAAMFISSHSDRERNVLTSSLMTQRETMRGTLSYIRDSINRLVANEHVRTWANSEWGDTDYYYSALKIYQATREETTFQDYLDYTVSVTGQDPRAFVITSQGTLEKNALAFTPDETLMQDGVFIPGVYRTYRDNSLLLVTNRKVDDSILTFLTTFRLPEELVSGQSFTYSVYDQKRDVMIARSRDFAATAEKIKWAEDGSMTTVDGMTCFTDTYADLGISVIYSFLPPRSYSIVILTVTAAVLLIVSVIFLMYSAAKFLYRPVGRTLQEVTQDGDEVRDEFEVIVSRCRDIEQLSRDLEEALMEQKLLSEQQKYRAFLRGVPYQPGDNDATSFFTVAAVQFMSDDEELNLLFAKLDTHTKDMPHLHFVRMNFQEAALVSKADTARLSRANLLESVRQFNADLNEKVEMKCGISDTAEGYDEIARLYGRAAEILSYRYKFSNKTVLTEEDVKGESERASFPLSEFNRLITALLASSPDALTIYDSAVERNRKLSFTEHKTFSYTMINTAIRYFQDLKTTPEELLSRPVDWTALYACSDPAAAIMEVRQILASAISVRREKDELESSDLVGKMKDYINSHFRENIMLVDLAAEFNLTPKYCSQLFGELSNDNFKNYLNRLRINEACREIEKDPEVKITALGLSLGFSSANTFIRVFSKYVGITPKLFAEKIIKEKR